MAKYSIRVENLGKKYRIHRGKRRVMLRQVLEDTVKAKVNALRLVANSDVDNVLATDKKSFWALKDISFELRPGESIGIIGSNGAGKSTLLKILSRVTTPSEGRVRLRGRVGSLLEVGTGFHPELTGRENVYFNGSVLGMSRQEIKRKFDEIVAFSEVEEFLDTPVKFYSSGMKLRLAFSVAAHLDPEILLVDEVLAVGDAAFQKKSLNKMENVVRDGRTVLFVSHNLSIVRALCSRGIYIQNGQMKYFGNMDDAINTYLDSGDDQTGAKFYATPNEGLLVQVMEVALGKTGSSSNSFPHDGALSIRIKFVVRKPMYQMSIGLFILDKKLTPVITSYDFEEDEKYLQKRVPGVYSYQINIPPSLVPGQYRLTVHANRLGAKGTKSIDVAENICSFEIYDNGSSRSRANVKWSGVLAIPVQWKLQNSWEKK